MSGLKTLVTVSQLAGMIRSLPTHIRILDSSWFLPVMKRNGREEYHSSHVPGALFFDIDDCIDKSSSLEHMLPSAGDFEKYVGDLGIGNDTHVLVYDNGDLGLFSAQRVWWTFRAFGHESVSLLDGGFKTWRASNHPVTSDVIKVEPKTFKATFQPGFVKSFSDVEANIEEKKFQLVDARSAGRFNGTAPEPRPDTKPGHVPGAKNIPFPSILDPNTNTVRSKEELQAMFSSADVDLSKPMVASCGSGVTACGLVLAAYLCGKPDVAVFDGAWVEWYKKSRPDQRVNSS